MTKVFHEFKAIIHPDSEILILGSFPSVKSRELHFFYMHPQNRFWRVLSEIYQDDFINVSIEEKRNLLFRYHIALYDVIESCEIEGSSDASIQAVQPTNINDLIHKTRISQIYLNGQKAFHLFEKYNKNSQISYQLLPSTSPANAKMTLGQLIEAWKVINLKK